MRSMAEEKEQDNVEKIVAKQLKHIPDEAASLRKYINNVASIVHYYFERFGPYMTKDMRKELAKLALESDILTIEMEKVRHVVETLEAEVRKDVTAGGKPRVDRRKRERLRREIRKTWKRAEDIGRRTTQFLDGLIRYIEENGVE